MKAAITVLVFILGYTSASAQVPQMLNYQGYLTDLTGQAIDSPVSVTFALYTVDSGGAPVWTNTQLITPGQGLFNAQLGNTANPFPANLFDLPLYLGLTVDGDGEMTPRVALSSAAYSQKALDAQTLNGLSAGALDQSGEVATLASDLAVTQSGVTQLQTDLSGAQADIAVAQGDIGQVQIDVGSNDSEIGQLQSDLTTVEKTLPTLQSRVTGVCSSGSSIRAVAASGSVTCEIDNTGPWITLAGDTYVLAGDVGVGTSAPLARMHIEGLPGTDLFRARLGGATKLMVHGNGAVSVGTPSPGPVDGLYVLGDIGAGTGNPAARLTLADTDWQMTLRNGDTGGTEWYVGSSANAWSSGGGKLVFSPTGISSNAAMVIDDTKNVGIATSAPETRLHIKGGTDVASSGGGYMTLGDTSSANIAIDNNEIMARNNGAPTVLALNAEGGLVSVNVNGSVDDDAFKVIGDVELVSSSLDSIIFQGASAGNDTSIQMVPSGFEDGRVGSVSRPFFSMYSRSFFAAQLSGFQIYSDRSLKDDVKPIRGALDTITRLQGVSYAMKPHPYDDGERIPTPQEQFESDNQLGFIAQEVEAVLPQLVRTESESGLKTMGYMSLIPLLVEGMKEQQRQIEAQQTEIAELRNMIAIGYRR